MQNFFHLMEGNVAFHHALLKFSPCRNKMLLQLVCIAGWYSIHALLQQPNLAVGLPTSSSLSLGKNQRAVLLRRDAEAATAICCIAGDVFVFQQDNAPEHCACDTVEFLRSETPQFVTPDMWPANSPDLNLINYCIWGMLQERVYRVPIRDMDKLRKHLVATWAGFQQSMVDDAVGQWRKRLEACIPCRRWSLLTLAVTLPAWHSSCHTSQNVFFSEPPMPTHDRLFPEPPTFWGTQHYFSSDEKVLHFTR